MSDATRLDPMLVHVLRFGRALREHDVPVSLSGMIDLCRSFHGIDLSCRDDLHVATRAVLVAHKEHFKTFDRVFDLFWYGSLFEQPRDKSGEREDREDHEQTSRSTDRAAKPQGKQQTERDEGDNATESSLEHSEYAPHESIRDKDLSTLSAQELAQARRIIAGLLKQFPSCRSRRSVNDNAGDRLDIVRMQRRSLHHGLLPFDLYYRRRKVSKPRLVLLCDVSGSMERYSGFLVQFICGMREEVAKAEIGLFATRLTMVTSLLDRSQLQRSITQLSKRVVGWGSGTNIGASLSEFNDSAIGRNLQRKATVVILSDGWDCGDAAEMNEQMQRLRRSARRLVWLNPLLGRANYEPLCQGILAALPYLDHFLPAHNINSLEDAYHLIRTAPR